MHLGDTFSAPERVANAMVGASSLLDQERDLARNYGSLYGADKEKQRRKDDYSRQYFEFKDQMEDHKNKTEHLATRNKIWTEARERKETEIAKCRSRIEELEAEIDTSNTAQTQLNERYSGDVQAYEEDKETERKYEAYFALQSDELDV